MQALFSIVFFNMKTNKNGSETLTIGRQWWLFPIITIPLIILVFATWITWQWHRKQVDLRSLGICDLTEIVEPNPILEKISKQSLM